MSRSRPDPSLDPNPAGRWHEWQGEHGVLRWYDKTAKTNIDVPAGFTFLLLDQLSSIRGWHEPSMSTIYANEVRDTRSDVLQVRACKGGELVTGKYQDIKARVKELGAHYVAHCYVAWKNGGGELALGVIRWKGAALAAWSEFCKGHRSEVYARAIAITGVVEGVKGRVHYKVPVFTLRPTSPATEAAAKALDDGLQNYLARYLARAGVAGPAVPRDVLAADPVEDRSRGEAAPEIGPEGEARAGDEEDPAMWADPPAWVDAPSPVEADDPPGVEAGAGMRPFDPSDEIPF